MTEFQALYTSTCEENARLKSEIIYLKQDKDILYRKISDLHSAMRDIIKASNSGEVIAIATKATEDTKCYTLPAQYSLPL